MNITRNNYEEFFMLYADNELPAAERKEVEAFVAVNPDLQPELALFQQFQLSPDVTVVFTGKEALMKQENGGETITIANYESFFVLYADDELTNDEKATVEDFVYHHPQLQSAFELPQVLRFSPDTSIFFENKQSLYRKEKDDKVIPFRLWKLAVAAMILLMAGIFWLYQAKKNNQPSQVVKNTPPVTIPQQPSLHKKNIATNNIEQPVRDVAAVPDTKKEKLQVKNQQTVHTVPVSVKKENNQGPDNLPKLKNLSVNKEDVAIEDKNLKGTTIHSINKSEKKPEINTGITAAANTSVTDQQLTYFDTGENNKVKTELASLTNDDKVEVLNTSVNTKNSLRSFFRKTSRLFAKKTNPGNEDSNRKSILVGGFEIAVR